MKKKILQVVGSLRRGGVETVSFNLYKYIDRNKFEFHYLVYGDEVGELEEEVRKLGGKVLRVNKPTLNIRKFINDVRKILRDYGPYDIVHSHPLFNSGLIMKACNKENIPQTITHAHSSRKNCKSSILKKIYMQYMRYNIIKYSNYIVACSEDAGTYLFGKKIFNKYGIVLKNGIDTEKYIFNEKIRSKVRKELNIDDKTILIGHVGRLTDVKNQEFILELLAKLKNSTKKFKLLLVGDGEDKSKLIIKAKEMDIYDDVIFLGSRDDVNILLQGMDIFIFPSKYEGLGIALIEAQATGLPCIISNHIPKEVDITNNIERISLIEPFSKWIEKIIIYSDLISNRENKINKLKENGFDINDSMNRIFGIYEKAINR